MEAVLLFQWIGLDRLCEVGLKWPFSCFALCRDCSTIHLLFFSTEKEIACYGLFCSDSKFELTGISMVQHFKMLPFFASLWFNFEAVILDWLQKSQAPPQSTHHKTYSQTTQPFSAKTCYNCFAVVGFDLISWLEVVTLSAWLHKTCDARKVAL